MGGCLQKEKTISVIFTEGTEAINCTVQIYLHTLKQIPLLQSLYDNKPFQCIQIKKQINKKTMLMIIKMLEQNLFNHKKADIFDIMQLSNYFGIELMLQHCYNAVISDLCITDEQHKNVLANDQYAFQIINIIFGDTKKRIILDECNEKIKNTILQLAIQKKIKIRIKQSDIYLLNNFIGEQCVIPNNIQIEMNSKFNIADVIFFTNVEKSITNIYCKSDQITDQTVKHQFFQQLYSLQLKTNLCISNYGLQYLRNLCQLELLQMNNITDDGLQQLINIQQLKLHHNTMITDIGLQYLSEVSILKLPHNNKITDIGLLHLKNIIKLDLRCNMNITEIGLDYVSLTMKTINLYYNTNISFEYVSCARDKIHIINKKTHDIWKSNFLQN